MIGNLVSHDQQLYYKRMRVIIRTNFCVSLVSQFALYLKHSSYSSCRVCDGTQPSHSSIHFRNVVFARSLDEMCAARHIIVEIASGCAAHTVIALSLLTECTSLYMILLAWWTLSQPLVALFAQKIRFDKVMLLGVVSQVCKVVRNI